MNVNTVVDEARLNQMKYFSFKLFIALRVQYVVLGPRVKIIILNILPESKRSKQKFSLKIAFMFLAIMLKCQVSN